MNSWVIKNVRVLQPGEGIVARSLRARDGKIAELDVPDAEPGIDGGGRLLTPGLIDVHTHGIHEFGYENSPEAIVDGAGMLGRYGTTCVLPTLYNVMARESLGKLESLAAALAGVRGADMPGFHLEGPFLALTGAGAATTPGDLGLLEDLLAATGGRVAAVSISPDTENVLPVIERLVRDGIAVFMTHTAATAEQTRSAIDAGARHATHFYCVFPVPKETDLGVRPVGAVEAILADPRCSVDFVCDGVHTDPVAIRATLAAKGPEGVVAITDSNIGAGLAAGTYDTPAGYRIRVSPDDAARIDDPSHPFYGALAGSTLTMDRAVANLLRWLDLPSAKVWAMATRNPARLLGLEHKGVIRVGADADLVLWDAAEDGPKAVQTWVGGRCVYEANSPVDKRFGQELHD
jgi:N-acetylglucosamine-6-phosphate deacetylase